MKKKLPYKTENENLPNKADKLFRKEINPVIGAWPKNPDNKFFLYSAGYREAGKIIYEFCMENKFYTNILIYPLIFNYRQFVELRLKELIVIGYKYLDEKKDFADIHDLKELWKTYKKEILVNIKDYDTKTLDNVEGIILQFNSEDPKSMCFRYPVSRGPNRKDSIKRESLDLENFKTVIDKLIYFLDEQWYMISFYQDMKAEMIATMYSGYYH